MTHELVKKFGLVTASLRYQCECDNQEVIAIQVALPQAVWENEAVFLDMMRSARRDMIAEVRQHIKGAK